MFKRAIIHVSGVVQGVGLRPFIYSLAVDSELGGYVRNLGDAGVEIVVEGEEACIENFLKRLVEEKPPLAIYERLNVGWDIPKGLTKFKIEESDKKAGAGGFSNPPPDTAICDKCLEELFTEGGRRYLYPFTVCSQCGPRFTIIIDLPYDRVRTSMVDFPMCRECSKEYHDPLDRRHHAEPTCCWNCGPRMKLYSIDGSIVDTDDPIKEAAKLIEEGYLVGVKGVGGVHVASLASDDDVLAKLRKRKRRPQRPLAIMSKSVEQVVKYAYLSKVEEGLLTSFRRPILLLKKLKPFPLSELISPRLDSVGVMLAYSGIHHVLLSYLRELAIVMTSGNEPGEPMAIDNDAAFKQLKGIVDYILLHNRRVVNRCDDSVVKVVDGQPNPIRRSRGYVMEPFKLSFRFKGSIMAVGAEENVAGGLLKDDHAYLTQYIGDVDRLETYDYLASSLENLRKLLHIEKVEAVACDLHPQFLTRRLAKELAELFKAEFIEVQHHNAHALSLVVDHGLKLDESLVCITADGLGYGLDGEAWGGEVLLTSYADFRRIARLAKLPMPGGDLCARYPARMFMSALSEAWSVEEAVKLVMSNYLDGFRYGEAEVNLVANQLKKRSHTYTTGAGRVLDAASAMLKVCYERTYEGEPAIKLEALASEGNPDGVKPPIEIEEDGGGCLWLKTHLILAEAFEAFNRGARRADVAAAVQEALAKGLAHMAIEAARREGLKTVGFSGGVAYNDYITRRVRIMVEDEGMRFYRHVRAPSGDGGIALGQLAIAAVKINEF